MSAGKEDQILRSELEVLRDYLRRHGMRFTPEREAICREVFARHDHFTVDELYLDLRRKRRISRASLYRTIPILIAAGLISEVFTDSGQTRYEHTYGHEHHCHLLCLECGRVVEFAEPSLKQVEQRVAREHGFVVRGHRLEVHGLCPRCQGKEKEGRGRRREKKKT
jgi:Fur family ferric uptake transcriptional regulator